jgi:hypothetical protein
MDSYRFLRLSSVGGPVVIDPFAKVFSFSYVLLMTDITNDYINAIIGFAGEVS